MTAATKKLLPVELTFNLPNTVKQSLEKTKSFQKLYPLQ